MTCRRTRRPLENAPVTRIPNPVRMPARRSGRAQSLRTRRRGLALPSLAIALLVSAFVLDRLASGVARERADSTAAAAFEQIRTVAEAAAAMGADPVAAGRLPHLALRRDVSFTYRTVSGAADRLVFDWSTILPRARPVLGARLGEWLGRDRITTPLELALDAVPPPYPERLRRAAPVMNANLESVGITGIGRLSAARAIWRSSRSGSVIGRREAAATAADVSGRSTATSLRLTGTLGSPARPATVSVGTAGGLPTPGGAGLRVARFTGAGFLSATEFTAETGRFAATLAARALIPVAAGMVDLETSRVIDLEAKSVRVTGRTTTGSLTVKQACIGCEP